MNVGDLVGPIESDFGFHIVRLDEILERGPLPIEQVRSELLTELRERETDDAYRALERSLSDALFDSSDLQEISATVGIELQSAVDFTRFGGEPFGSNQAAIDAIFADGVRTGEQVSEIIELDANSAAIVSVTEYREAARAPLAEVSDQIVAMIRDQEADRMVNARVEQLLEAIAAGEDFGAAAEAVSATVENPRLIGRQDEGVDRAVMFEVFAAKKPTQDSPVTGRVANEDGGYTVYSLDAVLPGRPESIPLAERDTGKRQLALQAGGADYASFIQALYNNADIVINQDALATSGLLQ